VSATTYGPFILDVLVGVGALLVGIGVFVGMLALAKTAARLRETLDNVDRQLENVGPPVVSTLTHVDEACGSLEDAAGALSRTVDLARSAVVPSIINIGSTVGGITAGLRRLVMGKGPKGQRVGNDG